MDFSSYISFDLTACTGDGSWSVNDEQPAHGRWAQFNTSPLVEGQSYGETVATGTSNSPTSDYDGQVADLAGAEGSEASIILTGPVMADQNPAVITCKFGCPTGLSANWANVSVSANASASYAATVYTVSGDISSSNHYKHEVENSDHPLYIIFKISSV